MGGGDGRTRRGVFISVGATRGERLFDGVVLTVKYFFDAIGVRYAGDLLVKGVDGEAHIREHATAVEDALRLGRQLVSPHGSE